MEDPDADTEWNDILRERGILPKKNGPTEEEIFEALDEAIAARNAKRLEEKSLEELDELEDEEDDRVLLEYRIPECKLMNALLSSLAMKYKSTKFLKIIGDDCIPGYPDKNLPTLLIYGEGDLQQQIVGIQRFGGMGTTINVLEDFLESVGAIEIFKQKGSKDDYEENASSTRKSIYSKKPATAALSDDDDDSD
ncbi:13441_t:CDS:2 [Ambispora leptoticha]|uniref:13441_t:CDS:1 n=1 Tax=Ambispora leptoticha TaxID=144679 RepID=A0A9N8ZQA4_9GLOM|nr:13441_t:CDS:2 [Ambispora leptoticha]